MASDRILAVTKHIIREGAKLGIDEVGTRIFGSAWMPVKNVVLTPVFGELQKRYPKLFLADDPEALAAAKQAEAALVSDPMLKKMLEEGFAKVAGSNDEILRALARFDETLSALGSKVDAGFQRSEAHQQEATQAILDEIKTLKLEMKDFRAVAPSLADGLSLDDIYLQASTYQYDALKWISPQGAPTASRRLAEGRALLMSGLRRDPENARLLVALGYIEKTQAQVSEALGKYDEAVGLLSQAATYFTRAFEEEPTNISAMNGIANVYYFAKDYDRAIQLGMLIFNTQPEYGAAVLDLSLAIEGKLGEIGMFPPLVNALMSIYTYLEGLMPQQPETFPASYLAHVQKRMRELAPYAA